MKGVSKPKFICYRCQREFIDRTGATYKHGMFRCAGCQPKSQPK